MSEFVIARIDPPTAAALAGRGAVLLDVRSESEWAAGHIAMAQHLPLGDLDPALLPRDRPIVAVCRSGNRSEKAAKSLRALGFSQVYNLAGGVRAWQQSGRPLVTADGRPGKVE